MANIFQVREVYIEAMSGPTLEHPKFQRCFELLNLMSKQDLVQKLTEVSRLSEILIWGISYDIDFAAPVHQVCW